MSNLNPLNYIYDNNKDVASAPQIVIDMNNISENELKQVQDNYMVEAEKYKNSFQQLLNKRFYIQKRLFYDLSAETKFLTKEGINKQTNALTLHVKADNIFRLSRDGGLNYEQNVVQLINNFEELNDNIVLSDDYNSSALITSYEKEAVYDEESKTFTIADLGTFIFIKEVANSEGLSQVFKTYTSNLGEDGKYINTAIYTLQYDSSFDTYDDEGEIIRIAVWKLVDNEGMVKFYTQDDILTQDVVEWIAFIEVVESSSSESEEVIESSSSESEEI